MTYSARPTEGVTTPPNKPRIGALFAGYGGLDMAVEDVYGGDVAWYSEIDKGALKILGHRYPDVPNVGSVTDVDWAAVEPVDILTGGSPCQDLSHAGRRAGMTDGTRSNLWVAMREAIAQLRPQKVIWENVRGAYSAAADSAVEPCAGCVGDRPAVHLRALGRVLGDLSDLGYDCRWHGLRAADVGAPHGRFRVFVVAEDAQRQGWGAARDAAPGQATGGRASALVGRPGRVAAGRSLQPACCDPDGVTFCVGCGEDIKRGRRLPMREAILLPTPAVNDMGEGKTVDRWDEWTATMQAKHSNGNGHGKSLAIELQRVESGWGPYTPAVEHWARIIGREAPPPSDGAGVREWMMGLPAGWVTDVPGITRNEALKALGNGVVPQQAAAAMRVMESWAEVAA